MVNKQGKISSLHEYISKLGDEIGIGFQDELFKKIGETYGDEVGNGLKELNITTVIDIIENNTGCIELYTLESAYKNKITGKIEISAIKLKLTDGGGKFTLLNDIINPSVEIVEELSNEQKFLIKKAKGELDLYLRGHIKGSVIKYDIQYDWVTQYIEVDVPIETFSTSAVDKIYSGIYDYNKKVGKVLSELNISHLYGDVSTIDLSDDDIKEIIESKKTINGVTKKYLGNKDTNYINTNEYEEYLNDVSNVKGVQKSIIGFLKDMNVREDIYIPGTKTIMIDDAMYVKNGVRIENLYINIENNFEKLTITKAINGVTDYVKEQFGYIAYTLIDFEKGMLVEQVKSLGIGCTVEDNGDEAVESIYLEIGIEKFNRLNLENALKAIEWYQKHTDKIMVQDKGAIEYTNNRKIKYEKGLKKGDSIDSRNKNHQRGSDLTKAERIIEELVKAGYEAYIVGGYVRDKLLGIESYDADVATSATYEEVRKVLKGKMALEEVGANFSVLLADGIEVASYRKDEYNGSGDGKPKVSHVGTLEDDAGRRDFTINALYVGLDGQIVDKFGGQQDIKRKVIRCVGDADARFKEDGSRILRAIYLASKLGFTIDKGTVDAMQRNKHLLNTKVPNELKGKILRKVMKTSLSSFLRITMELGLMDYIIPELTHLKGLPQNPKYHVYDKDTFEHVLSTVEYMDKHYQGNEVYLLTMMLHDVAKGIDGIRIEDEKGLHDLRHEEVGAKIAKKVLRRLNFGKETVNEVSALVMYHGARINNNMSDENIHKLLNNMKGLKRSKEELGEFVEKLLIVMTADSVSFTDDLKEEVHESVESLGAKYKEVIDTHHYYLSDIGINGKDIQDINPFLKGKEIGLILQGIVDENLQDIDDIEKYVLMGKRHIKKVDNRIQQRIQIDKSKDQLWTELSEPFLTNVKSIVEETKSEGISISDDIKIYGKYTVRI